MEAFFTMMAKSIVTMAGMKLVRTGFKGTFEGESLFRKYKLHGCPKCGKVYSGVIENCRRCGEEMVKMYEERYQSNLSLSDSRILLVDDSL